MIFAINPHINKYNRKSSKDGDQYKGFAESGVVIVSNRVNGVLSRITIGGTFRGQTVILVYKRINSK